MNKYEYIVGIDPDVAASGVCFFMRESMTMELKTLRFPNLIDYLGELNEATGGSLVVVVEAGWINKSNWHTKRGDNLSIAALKGKHVGENHQTGKLIVEMIKHKGINVMEKSPLKKMWKGDHGKIIHNEIVDVMGNAGIKMPRKTNQETRDATLLAYDYSGLPMRINSKTLYTK